MERESYPSLQHYRHGHDLDRYSDYTNGFDGNVDGLLYVHQLRLQEVSSSMDRFLQEKNDSRLFKASFHHGVDEQTMQPYPDYALDHRLPSPISSGSQGSSHVDSGCSDRQESPQLPLMSGDLMLQHHTFNEGVPYAYGGNPPSKHNTPRTLNVCNMQDIQECPDHVPEVAIEVVESMHFGAYGSYAQEGYQPLHEIDDCVSEVSCCAPPSEYQPSQMLKTPDSETPVIRRRRAQSRTAPSPVTGSRVSKRSHPGRRSSFSASNRSDANNESAPGNRAFACPLAIYGCNSFFGSKNEWKRHVNTQHMRLGFWRCDQCTNDRKPNDFNRKDLFIQHVRRMHPVPLSPRSNTSNKKSGSKSPKANNGDEAALQAAAMRCYKSLRSSPEASGCLFCDQTFRGRNTWDDRMEHIGRHMETTKKENKEPEDPRDWREDEMAHAWMEREQIIVPTGNKRWTLATP